jgi:hypothetical protein
MPSRSGSELQHLFLTRMPWQEEWRDRRSGWSARQSGYRAGVVVRVDVGVGRARASLVSSRARRSEIVTSR